MAALVLLLLLLAAPFLVQLVLTAALALVRAAAAHSPFTIPSTIFLASAKSIMVLSRKKSSFSTPA